ncbi:MAG: hypothetical protein QM660_13710 [Dysgonomonas sp.]
MKITIIILSTLLVALLIPVVIYAPWIFFGKQQKQNYANTYAIQNVSTGKDIRVKDVGVKDESEIILYTHNEWECLTWEFIQLENNTYLLKNLCTQKTFAPSSSPKQGVDLWQQSLGGSHLQYWEFIKQSNGTCLIRLKDTELYLTATSNEDNSPIILMSKQNSDKQLWKLIKQNPIYK